jgi:hypothetical protein
MGVGEAEAHAQSKDPWQRRTASRPKGFPGRDPKCRSSRRTESEGYCPAFANAILVPSSGISL